LATRRDFEAKGENGGHGRLLAATAIGALAAALLLTTSATRLLSSSEVLHSRQHRATEEILHIGPAAHESLLSAIAALEHLRWVGKAHVTETALLPRAAKRALPAGKAPARSSVAGNARAGAHSTAGGR
jgi:hypothetical protein